MTAAYFRKKIYDNIGVILFSIAAVLVLIISIYASVLIRFISSYLKESINEQLLTASNSLSHLVTPEELEGLRVPADMERPLFIEIRRRLRSFAEENHVLYAYYFRVDLAEDRMYYIVDNDDDPETVVNLASPGEPIEEEEVRQVIRDGRAVATNPGDYVEGWPGLISAYAPVFDSHGEVVAIAGVDISDVQLHSTQNRSTVLSVILLLSMAFVVAAGFGSFVIFSKKEFLFSQRLKQQELMSRLAQSLINARDTDFLINEALRITGEFMGVTRMVIGIAETDSAVSNAVYVWVSPNHVDEIVTAPKKEGLNDIINSFPVNMPTDGSVPSIYCDDITLDERYAAMALVGVKSFIMAPLYVDGKFWAVLTIEECIKARQWTESDRQLINTVSSVIAGEAIRALREKERNAALEES
ncbi:MAG: GAF domain-containing protein, partial [Treponema sp.]|nr:GAF domain-containing protein [Treponema sp.]